MVFFIKYEFWCNYLSELKRRNIPVYSVSSIFRPQQIFFRWYGGSYKNVLKCFDHLFVQNEESVRLLESIGVTRTTVVEILVSTGYWKFAVRRKNYRW